MIFTAPPKTIGGQRFPFKIVSEVHAYASVVTICTAEVPVGYVFIWPTVYFGFFELLRNWAKTGAAPLAPLLKVLNTYQQDSCGWEINTIHI